MMILSAAGGAMLQQMQAVAQQAANLSVREGAHAAERAAADPTVLGAVVGICVGGVVGCALMAWWVLRN